MTYDPSPGNVLECVREHFAFAKDGDIVAVNEGELLIVVEIDGHLATALRVETSQCVSIMFLELFGVPETYRVVWP